MPNRRTSNESKRIRGTDTPSREREESRAVPGEPGLPDWLPEAGETRFRTYAKQLTTAGHLTTVDGAIFGRLLNGSTAINQVNLSAGSTATGVSPENYSGIIEAVRKTREANVRDRVSVIMAPRSAGELARSWRRTTSR